MAIRATIEVHGSQFGHVSLSVMAVDQDTKCGGGARLLGPKAWGGANTIYSWELSLEKIQKIIEELLAVQSVLEEQHDSK